VLGLSGPVRCFGQAETRIGLKTSSGRKLTAKGIKPKGKVPWPCKATDRYGLVAPATGAPFFDECTPLNSAGFQVLLAWVSEHSKDCLRLSPLAQAGAQQAKRLKLPANSLLLFQPSHAPETHPMERVWQPCQWGWRWPLPKDLDEWRLLRRARLEAMTPTVIAALVGWHSMLNALSVAGL
jgi:hypothetical protein